MNLIDKNNIPYITQWIPDSSGFPIKQQIVYKKDIDKMKTLEIPTAHWKISFEEAGAFETTRTYYFGHCSKCGRKIEIKCFSGLHNNKDLNLIEEIAYSDYPYCHCGAKMEREVET